MFVTQWLKDRWNKIKGRFLQRGKERKKSEPEIPPIAYITSTAKQLPPKRSRRHTSTKAIRMQLGMPSASSESKLLSLPTEVRFLIWQYTFGGNLIALYRVRRRLTHTLLGDHNSQATIGHVAITPESIKRALEQLPGTTRENPKEITSSKKLRVLAPLQSCRSM